MRTFSEWLVATVLLAVASSGPAAAQFLRPPFLMCTMPIRLDVLTVSTRLQCVLTQRNARQVAYVATMTRLRYDMLGTRPGGVIRWTVSGTGDLSGGYAGDAYLVGGANRAITLQPTQERLPMFNVAKNITGLNLQPGRLR